MKPFVKLKLSQKSCEDLLYVLQGYIEFCEDMSCDQEAEDYKVLKAEVEKQMRGQ